MCDLAASDGGKSDCKHFKFENLFSAAISHPFSGDAEILNLGFLVLTYETQVWHV